MSTRTILAPALLAALVGCGDPATEDRRGYTKAPLENPGLLVEGEQPTAMAEVRRPNRPRPVELEAPGTEEEAAAGGAQEASLAPGVTQEQFDQGRQLFSGEGGCQACHGPEAGGTQLGPDLTDAEWLNVPGPDVEALAELIRTGVPQPQAHPAPMPPMGGANLSPEQVQTLAAYVASIGQG